MRPSDYARLSTERENPRSARLDRMSAGQIVRLMNREDRRVAAAVAARRGRIARGMELIARRLASGGRLFMAGAGTSGRLGVIEAAECPPTFDTPPALVQAIMAGGPSAVFRSKEGAEDSAARGAAEARRRLRRGDVLVGIAASGVTPFVGAALAAARRRRAGTILVTCNPRAAREGLADVTIALNTGPEVLTGSTRLKAGSACKMVLNMLTTGSMVLNGKAFGHWMVDLQPKSRKLAARGLRLIVRLGRVSEPRARSLYREAGGRVKTAILMARRGMARPAAEAALRRARGFLGRALEAGNR